MVIIRVFPICIGLTRPSKSWALCILSFPYQYKDRLKIDEYDRKRWNYFWFVFE